MTRICRDSTNLDDIPAGSAPLIGAYGDGGFRPTAAQVQRHIDAGSKIVWITTGQNPTTEPVADCERGDYLPWETVNFCIAKRGQGIDPTVYVSYDLWAATQTEFRLRGVTEPHWWVALWDGSPVMIPGAIAKQWGNPNFTHAHYDESIVADFWPGIDNTFGPGVGGDEMTQAEFDALVQNNPQLGALGYAARLIFALAVTYHPDHPELETSTKIEEILAELKTLSGGGTAPEPKNVTLHVPTIDIPGTLS